MLDSRIHYYLLLIALRSDRLRHVYMVLSEIITLLIYAISIVFLPEYFGMSIPVGLIFAGYKLTKSIKFTPLSLISLLLFCRSWFRNHHTVRMESWVNRSS